LALAHSQGRERNCLYGIIDVFSQGGRLILVKLVLEAIPIYWMYLFFIPKGILEKIEQLSDNFVWSISRKKRGIALVKWYVVSIPKHMRGWVLKNIHYFKKYLVSKCVW
jgi:hypothetical protein